MFKSMTSRLSDEMERRDAFGGAVFPPGTGMPVVDAAEQSIRIKASTAVPTEESVCGLLVSRLMNTKPVSVELQEEKANLIAAATEIGTQIDEFLANVSSERFISVVKQHSEIRTQGKRQMGVLNAAVGEFNQANAYWNAMKAEKDTAIEHVRQAIYQREHLSRWASDSEIDAAELKVSDAKAKASKAVEQEALAVQERNRRESLVGVERAKLNTLANEEIRLRKELEQKPHFDPEFGLSTAPTGVVSQ
jgi:hypothetical protein